jgi:multidrug efflux pump subunit AcrB
VFNKRSRDKKTKIPLFARIGLFFYGRPRFSLLIWLAILVFGIASYTTLLKREGFPTINVPYSMVTGTYLVDSPAKVDADVGKPLSRIISSQPDVKFSDVTSSANYFTAIIQYEEDTDAKAAAASLGEAIDRSGVLPKEATVKSEALSVGVNERGDDMLVSFYSKNNDADLEALVAKANRAADYLKAQNRIPLASSIEVIDPFARGTDPATGQQTISQKTFDRFGYRQDDQNNFYTSVNLGIKGVKGFDVLELNKQVQTALDSLNNSSEASGYKAQISFSLAPQINDQIDGLQRALLEGLLAVLVISGLLIAFRASLITVSAMVMVIMTTLGVLYAIGYSLNTITLFSLILCLSLIVDDTIIMVEAIDAQRRKSKTALEAVKKASTKISRVMVAATLTAIMAFAPLIFVGGILGSFIRAIPVTVITSLLVSLFVALAFIPFLSRFLLLRKNQLGHGDSGDHESASHHLERFIARTLCKPLTWINHHRKREFSLGIIAVLVGLGFIFAGGAMFSKVGFNIFAPSKDSNQISVQMTFDPNQTIQQTQDIADQANKVIGRDLGVDFKMLSYYDTGSTQSATASIDLTRLQSRSITAPQLAEKVEKSLKSVPGATFKAGQVDVAGPPTSPFSVRIETDNEQAANKLASDLSAYMREVELKRPDGSTAKFKTVTISNPDSITRRDGNRYISVSAEFNGDDTSTLVILGKDAINKEFTTEKVTGYGLKSGVIKFDVGQEEENQDSFKTLLFAFPILLVAIYVLLGIQFRSLLQPILIFMAIPFSIFGITAGLWLTHNAFSFFTMLGFFALIGLSIKNTILLTDYANQARRSGSNPVEAVSISLQERFRPLVATSLTAIVSLIPLYLSDPFWEGLAVTLMFGLLSSTFLVITVFPYYYLGAEYMRLKISRKAFGLWLLVNIVLIAVLIFAKATAVIPLVILLTTVILPLIKLISKKRGKNNRRSV